jgi:hypothetical protein
MSSRYDNAARKALKEAVISTAALISFELLVFMVITVVPGRELPILASGLLLAAITFLAVWVAVFVGHLMSHNG